MIKRLLLLSVMLVLIAYLIMAMTTLNGKPVDQVCRDLELVLKDSLHTGFITKNEVADILQKKDIYPVGSKMEEIRTGLLEEELSDHPLIDQVECYKTPNGKVVVEVTQRIPIIRIMGRNGENYYIDNKGAVMPPDTKCVAHLAVATGHIEKSFAMRELYNFGVFLQKNKFWNAQIEQIHVRSDGEIELVPRVGDHIVFLGKIDRFDKKLSRLKTFYEKGLNKVGWNKYSRISLEFDNQIICTHKEEKK